MTGFRRASCALHVTGQWSAPGARAGLGREAHGTAGWSSGSGSDGMDHAVAQHAAAATTKLPAQGGVDAGTLRAAPMPHAGAGDGAGTLSEPEPCTSMCRSKDLQHMSLIPNLSERTAEPVARASGGSRTSQRRSAGTLHRHARPFRSLLCFDETGNVARTSWSVVVRTPRASRAHVSHAARACLKPHAALVLIDLLLEPLHHVLHRILGARAVVPSRVTPPSSIEESAGKLWHPVLRAAPPLVSAGCTR